jgi:hypothetical protein
MAVRPVIHRFPRDRSILLAVDKVGGMSTLEPRDAGLCRIRLTAPSDVLAVVPYLLGFHPQDSVVALLVRRGRVALTARVDLVPPDFAGELAADIGRLADQHGASELILVGYGSDAAEVRELLANLADLLEPYGLGDVLYADGRLWWSLRCTASCCPPEGTPYDLSTHAIAATAVYAGLGCRSDREALAAEVTGPPEAEHDALRMLSKEVGAEIEGLDAASRCELICSLVRTAVVGNDRPDDRTCALLGVLAHDRHVRDIAWSLITAERAEQHKRLWRQVVARTVSPYEAAPICLLGLAAWIGGDGALMNCCIERITTVDPDYSLGRLLAEISRAALAPSLWDDLAPTIRAGLSLLAG